MFVFYRMLLFALDVYIDYADKSVLLITYQYANINNSFKL